MTDCDWCTIKVILTMFYVKVMLHRLRSGIIVFDSPDWNIFFQLFILVVQTKILKRRKSYFSFEWLRWKVKNNFQSRLSKTMVTQFNVALIIICHLKSCNFIVYVALFSIYSIRTQTQSNFHFFFHWSCL